MTVDLARPLPALWDHVPVVWGAWRPEEWTTAELHGMAPVCEGCGSLERPLRATGRLTPAAAGDNVVQLAAPACNRLFVTRCRDCGLDSVYDFDHDELWTLDESDYGPDGSTFDGVLDADPEPLPLAPCKARKPSTVKPSRAELIAQTRAAIRRTREGNRP